MIFIDFSFIVKVITDAIFRAGYEPKNIKVEKEGSEIAIFYLFDHILMTARVSTSSVSETPAIIRLIKLSIISEDMIKIAEYTQKTLGDRTKIILQ